MGGGRGYGELRHSPHNSCKNVHRCLRQPQGIRPKRLEVTSAGGKKKQREKNGGGVVEGICTFLPLLFFFLFFFFFFFFLHVRSWHQRVINYVVKLSLALSVPEQKTNYFPIATVANLFVPKAALSPKRSKLRRSGEKGYILTAPFFSLKCRFLIRDLSVVFSLLSVHLCMDSVLQGCTKETEHCFSTV